MSQTPDPSRRAEEKHPEVFRDPDAGQASHDDRRPPETFELSAVRKGCLWGIVLTALLLLIVAVTWQWAWQEAPPRLPDPAEPDRPGVEAEPPAAASAGEAASPRREEKYNRRVRTHFSVR